MGTGYTTADEVWSHFKPTEEELDKWINHEDRGEKRIDEDDAMDGDGGNVTRKGADQDATDSTSRSDPSPLVSDAGRERQRTGYCQDKASRSDESTLHDQHDTASSTLHNGDDHGLQHQRSSDAAGPADSAEEDITTDQAPPNTWLGMLPALKDGPQQG